MSRDNAAPWLAGAPAGLVSLLTRMTFWNRIRWEASDYDEEDDDRVTTELLEDSEAVGSKVTEHDVIDFGSLEPVDTIAMRCLAIDIDVPAWLIPSSTEGHSHLYVDLLVTDDALWTFLDAAAEIGLVESGYVAACKARGMTSLRAPWVRKGAEVAPQPHSEALPASQHDDGAQPHPGPERPLTVIDLPGIGAILDDLTFDDFPF